MVTAYALGSIGFIVMTVAWYLERADRLQRDWVCRLLVIEVERLQRERELARGPEASGVHR